MRSSDKPTGIISDYIDIFPYFTCCESPFTSPARCTNAGRRGWFSASRITLYIKVPVDPSFPPLTEVVDQPTLLHTLYSKRGSVSTGRCLHRRLTLSTRLGRCGGFGPHARRLCPSNDFPLSPRSNPLFVTPLWKHGGWPPTPRRIKFNQTPLLSPKL